MDMRRLVGRNVKRIRLKNGWTQERFAEISGFTQQYISGLEQGRRNPTVVTVFELAQALGVGHEQLVAPGDYEHEGGWVPSGPTVEGRPEMRLFAKRGGAAGGDLGTNRDIGEHRYGLPDFSSPRTRRSHRVGRPRVSKFIG